MGQASEAVRGLCKMYEVLRQEWSQLQVIGRPLTKEEQIRLQELESLIPAFRMVLDYLQSSCEGTHPTPTIPANVLIDGRYVGGNHELYVELRVDECCCGVISADLYRNGATGRSYVASLRTNPGVKVSRGDGVWAIVGSDVDNRTAVGQLSLVPEARDGSSLTGIMRIDSALTGLPVGTHIHFAANHVSSRMRRLGIELEREENVDQLPSYSFDGTDVTVRSSLEAAGFDISNVGEASMIPVQPQNWGTSQLHTLMVDFAQAALNRPLWELHLLLLSESSRDGLLGIMFDTSEVLPRQGAAVFAKEIENVVSSDQVPRKLIQTTVHELGHGLNLAHRFERVVGRADSTSFMNYDWRYRGGGHRGEYWSNFAFTFDPDELEFLRHAPRNALIPGGASFHSVNYWVDGKGGYSPYVPEVPITFLKLTLRAPASGLLFDFAQPVFLGIELKNLSDTVFPFTPEILDPKAGLLEILIRRRDSDGPEDIFRPVMQRCFDLQPDRLADLAPGESFPGNLNLTYGSGGFPFAEPGEYDVKALLVFYDYQNQRDLIVESNTLRIRVRFPQSSSEENDALVLLREDVGLYFALGGSSVLSKASDSLQELQQRRQSEAKQITDPIIANIVRCAGIDAGRPYQRYVRGKFSRIKGDRAKAAELLDQLPEELLNRCFDAHTARSTLALAKKHRQAAGK